MKKFEYRFVSKYLLSVGAEQGQNGKESPQAFLNRLGQEGWELVSVTHSDNFNEDVFYLKREI